MSVIFIKKTEKRIEKKKEMGNAKEKKIKKNTE